MYGGRCSVLERAEFFAGCRTGESADLLRYEEHCHKLVNVSPTHSLVGHSPCAEIEAPVLACRTAVNEVVTQSGVGC